MYKVLARKWRPQLFDELVGQEHVSRALRNAISGDRLTQAYLFAGLRGTGKTTVARILAKCLNCENGPTTEPCGECAPCREIAESRSMDVLEIDAASRTKVEQTRELLEMVSYAPVRDRYKMEHRQEHHCPRENLRTRDSRDAKRRRRAPTRACSSFSSRSCTMPVPNDSYPRPKFGPCVELL